MTAKRSIWILIGVIYALFASTVAASELSGVWTKTTHPDPHNITLLIADAMHVKAIGYGMVSGKAAIWFGEGRVAGNTLTCSYRYSQDATPQGWENQGSMHLVISADGRSMHGKATASSGNWSGLIEFRKLKP